jgi:hypothetical protein
MRGLLSLALAALLLAGCGGGAARSERARLLTSAHAGWTIHIRPFLTESDERWRARVEVWPPDRNPQVYGGITLRFIESAPDEKTIVQAALAEARRYIEASSPKHQ